MAVNITTDQLVANVNGLSDSDVAARLLAVVTELVEIEFPDAPESIQNEQVIRAVAWLYQSSISVGQLLEDAASRSHAVNALRSSGARALGAPWRERRL